MPATHPELILTRKAAGAIGAMRLVTFDNIQAAVAGAKVLGVADYTVAVGKDVPVIVSGTAMVETGAAVAAGDSLTTDSQGRAIPAAGLSVLAGATPVVSTAADGAILDGGDPPVFVFADALDAASGAGKFIEILFRR